ncbi:MAG TPA: hypothetical protein VFO76_05110 [Candidatus Kapabacteria bacterium]|nr:hypothetical protein [Candidatus Kapabacteria bacterium]
MRGHILFIATIFLYGSIAYAQYDRQDRDYSKPFEVVEYPVHRLSADSVCKIVNDTMSDFYGDIIIESSRDIAYRYRGVWYECSDISDDFRSGSDYDVTYSTADIDLDGTSELLIKFTLRQYGSGGGTTNFYATIYKFDTVARKIFDADIGGADEMFGREYNNGAYYYLVCQQDLIFKKGQFVVLPASDKDSFHGGMRIKREKCDNTVPPGEYKFINGELTLISKRKQTIKRRTKK